MMHSAFRIVAVHAAVVHSFLSCSILVYFHSQFFPFLMSSDVEKIDLSFR